MNLHLFECISNGNAMRIRSACEVSIGLCSYIRVQVASSLENVLGIDLL